ncbi:Hypothetical protein ETEE_4153 [Edwardsiella anguillarum ET080813]|uniref:Uncharacterized protein n=1 Tax=Edwardsiella anguillarum ET080813 TaxID=667120 RepID=A0A076LVR8_9GAMM|nr:Hypothetical protein ETEE_4153 [Edwardsiella anguillarum ET080813]
MLLSSEWSSKPVFFQADSSNVFYRSRCFLSFFDISLDFI